MTNAVRRTLPGQRIGTRAGHDLVADVYLPASANERFPTVLVRTPYGRHFSTRDWLPLVARGFALVTCDVRGRGDSDGTFRPWASDSDDGYDVVEWCAAQPWSTGRVGMVGGSYEGLTQWHTAQARPPHLACIVPAGVGATRLPPTTAPRLLTYQGLYWGFLVAGRTLQNPAAIDWHGVLAHCPLRTLDERVSTTWKIWERYLGGADEYGGEHFALSDDDFRRLDVPVLIVTGWWDNTHSLAAWHALRPSPVWAQCELVVGPWDHAGTRRPRATLGGQTFPGARIDLLGYIAAFLHHHTAPDADVRPAARPPRRALVYRTGSHRWERSDTWPHPTTSLQLFLTAARGHDSGGALLRQPPISRSADTTSYAYDPNQPVRPIAALERAFWADPPLDIGYLLARPDVVTFTSDVLDEPLYVSGIPVLDVFVSTDSPSTDFYAVLVDVHPDGRALWHSLLPAGARLAPTHEISQRATPQRLRLALGAMHHAFLPGHRIQLAITSSWFPPFLPHPNVAADPTEATDVARAVNTIHHGPTSTSVVTLPTEQP